MRVRMIHLLERKNNSAVGNFENHFNTLMGLLRNTVWNSYMGRRNLQEHGKYK